MRKVLLFASSFVLAVLAYAQQTKPEDVISVCDLLRKPSRYNGKTIAIRGTNFYGGHGSYLKGEGCDPVLITKYHPWPAVIWLSLGREEYDLRGLNYEHRRKTEDDKTEAVFRAMAAKGFKSEVAKMTLTYVGLFETRERFDEQIGKPDDFDGPEKGFGAGGYAPAQLFVDSVRDIVVELK